MTRRIPVWAVLGGLLLLSGCGRLGYYAHCTQGQLALLAGRTPVQRLLADPATPADLAVPLRQFSRIRDFASAELHLPDNGSYRSYSDLQRPYATWNVVAAHEFELEPLRWCFPFAGCLPYQGFFDRQRAETFAAELQQQGNDTYLYGAAAYSTLGWFDDPILNTFLRKSPTERAGLVFHELAHQLLFVPNDPAFSEGFAMTVEQLGVERWLTCNDSPAAVAAYQQNLRREESFTDLLDGLRQQLEALYRLPLCPDCKRRAKTRLLESFSTEYDRWKVQWGSDSGFDGWVRERLNNAKLASVNTYHQLVPAFRALFAAQGNDFQSFYQAARRLSELPDAERRARLRQLDRTFCQNLR